MIYAKNELNNVFFDAKAAKLHTQSIITQVMNGLNLIDFTSYYFFCYFQIICWYKDVLILFKFRGISKLSKTSLKSIGASTGRIAIR